LFVCVPARAEDLEGARDNFDTIVRTYAMQRSDDGGDWTLKQRGTGKALKLRYSKIERETVHPIGGGRWRGIAGFTDRTGKKGYFAEVIVSTGGDLWDVKSWKWKDAGEAAELRAAAVKAARKRAERKPGPKGILPDLILTDTAGREVYLPDCAAKKCVTVYVTPWCPYCRAASGAIKALRDYLKDKGVPVRVIVGKDDEDKVREYAAEFGPDALLDPDAKMGARGVPHFYVSSDGGAVIAEQSGASPDEPPGVTAASLGL
jgi:glutaredoxin